MQSQDFSLGVGINTMHLYCSFTPFFRSYTCCLAIQFDDEIAVHWLAIAVHVQLFMVMATLMYVQLSSPLHFSKIC